MPTYSILVQTSDGSQWGDCGWLEVVDASNRHEAKEKAIAAVRKAIEQPDADLMAKEY